MKKAESILDPVASADLFEVTAIVQGNGLLGALLYPHVYPYFCCQAIRVHDAKELERLKEQFKGKNLPVYLPQRDGGAAGLLVVQTSGTSPGYSVEITQQNHAEVYEAAKCFSSLPPTGAASIPIYSPPRLLAFQCPHYSAHGKSQNFQN